MATKITVRIAPDEYDAFVKAIPSDEQIPATYNEWVQRGLKEDEKAISRGLILNEVAVDYDGFATYCRTTGQKTSYTMLLAYAVYKTSRNA